MVGTNAVTTHAAPEIVEPRQVFHRIWLRALLAVGLILTMGWTAFLGYLIFLAL
jgi:hypothetical protein